MGGGVALGRCYKTEGSVAMEGGVVVEGGVEDGRRRCNRRCARWKEALQYKEVLHWEEGLQDGRRRCEMEGGVAMEGVAMEGVAR